MTTSKITVAEALRRIEKGEGLEGVLVDFDQIKVEALNVMKLAKHGIEVPEEAIYYDDESIEYDEEFEGERERIDYDPVEEMEAELEVKIRLRKEIKTWVESQEIELSELIEELINQTFKTQKILTKK